MTLNWHSDEDDDGNTTWEANSAYHDDGTPFKFRLRPVLRNNRIEWTDDNSDEEVGCEGLYYLSIEEAKQLCQAANDTIIKECQ